eukprot:531320_1
MAGEWQIQKGKQTFSPEERDERLLKKKGKREQTEDERVKQCEAYGAQNKISRVYNLNDGLKGQAMSVQIFPPGYTGDMSKMDYLNLMIGKYPTDPKFWSSESGTTAAAWVPGGSDIHTENLIQKYMGRNLERAKAGSTIVISSQLAPCDRCADDVSFLKHCPDRVRCLFFSKVADNAEKYTYTLPKAGIKYYHCGEKAEKAVVGTNEKEIMALLRSQGYDTRYRIDPSVARLFVDSDLDWTAVWDYLQSNKNKQKPESPDVIAERERQDAERRAREEQLAQQAAQQEAERMADAERLLRSKGLNPTFKIGTSAYKHFVDNHDEFGLVKMYINSDVNKQKPESAYSEYDNYYGDYHGELGGYYMDDNLNEHGSSSMIGYADYYHYSDIDQVKTTNMIWIVLCLFLVGILATFLSCICGGIFGYVVAKVTSFRILSSKSKEKDQNCSSV